MNSFFDPHSIKSRLKVVFLVLLALYSRFIVKVVISKWFYRGNDNGRGPLNNENNNYDKYFGKKIIVCIITLESETPVFYDINIDNNILRELIEKFLYDKYSKYQIGRAHV